jgi:uncharacterized protein YndB with AHSA1/START domain
VRPGGLIHVDMRAPNGTIYPMPGVYREVVEPERLVFTAGALGPDGELLFEILNTVTFSESEGRTTLTLLTHVLNTTGEAAQYLNGHSKGWAQSLERLTDLLEYPPLIIERTFDAPVETVWKAISDGDQMKQWYFDMVGYKAEVGCEFSFCVEHEGHVYDHRCKVMEINPGKKLAYTWRYEGYEGNSLVTFELFPDAGKTRLKLTHEGLDTFPKIPHYARTNFERGWTSLIGTELKEFLSSIQ